MHDLAVGNGWVSGPEFWRLSPGQFWWIYRAKMPPEIFTRQTAMSEVRQMVKDEKAREKHG